jgi:hypothetical protein
MDTTNPLPRGHVSAQRFQVLNRSVVVLLEEMKMNERIRELAEQANELDYETFDEFNHKTVKHYKFNKEKFAKLIVRECLKIVEPTEDSGDEWCVTLKGTAQEIREHFEVDK